MSGTRDKNRPSRNRGQSSRKNNFRSSNISEATGGNGNHAMHYKQQYAPVDLPAHPKNAVQGRDRRERGHYHDNKGRMVEYHMANPNSRMNQPSNQHPSGDLEKNWRTAREPNRGSDSDRSRGMFYKNKTVGHGHEYHSNVKTQKGTHADHPPVNQMHSGQNDIAPSDRNYSPTIQDSILSTSGNAHPNRTHSKRDHFRHNPTTLKPTQLNDACTDNTQFLFSWHNTRFQLAKKMCENYGNSFQSLPFPSGQKKSRVEISRIYDAKDRNINQAPMIPYIDDILHHLELAINECRMKTHESREHLKG